MYTSAKREDMMFYWDLYLGASKFFASYAQVPVNNKYINFLCLFLLAVLIYFRVATFNGYSTTINR